ncbi:MAG TPA: TrkA family potassium uptake protein [Candidatus Rifleibacterium sp.]|nr:TrkA family potassium uptake protein [Candidatus Rifleibacterium sp.]
MQYAVIGLGRFGAKLASSIFAKGGEVMAIDKDPEAVDAVKDHVSQAVQCDCTNEKALRELGVQDLDVAIVAVGDNIETSILVTAILKRLGVHRILSRALTKMQGQILSEVGAHEVFSLEEQMGEQIADRLISPHILESIKLSSGHSLTELEPPSAFIGKSLKELNVRAHYGVNVIAIKTRKPAINEKGENIVKMVLNDLPSPDEKISPNDILVLVGRDEKIRQLSELDSGEA